METSLSVAGAGNEYEDDDEAEERCIQQNVEGL